MEDGKEHPFVLPVCWLKEAQWGQRGVGDVCCCCHTFAYNPYSHHLLDWDNREWLPRGDAPYIQSLGDLKNAQGSLCI